MEIKTIIQRQQRLFELWVDKGNLEYHGSTISPRYYTAIKEDGVFRLKSIKSERDHTKDYTCTLADYTLAKKSSSYYHTWLEEHSSHFFDMDRAVIYIRTAVNLGFFETARIKRSWESYCKYMGFDTRASVSSLYSGTHEVADLLSICGTILDFKSASDGWSSICDAYYKRKKEQDRQKKEEYEKKLQEYNGMYNNAEERFSALYPRIEAVLSSPIWIVLSKIRRPDHGIGYYWKSYSINSTGVELSDDDTSLFYSFESMGFNDIENADDLFAFAVVAFCRFYSVELKHFWDYAIWDGIVKPSAQEKNNKKLLYIDTPKYKDHSDSEAKIVLKPIF